MITKKILVLVSIILLLVFISGCVNNKGGVVEYTLTIINDGLGKVTDTQGYVIVTRKITANTLVSLVPLGETGTWCFDHWGGPDGAEVSDNQILMNSNKNITAVFKRLTRAVNITIIGEGTVTKELIAGATGLTIYNGDKIRLSPNPAAGWGFDHWERDGANNYNPVTELVVNTDITLTAIFIQPISYNGFQDDAESPNLPMRSSDTWDRTNLIFHNGAYSWTDSPGGSYTQSTDTSLISPPIDFTGSTLPFLTFWQRYDTSYGDDFCRVEVSTDAGKNWTELKNYTGTDTTWKQVSINLSDYKSQKNIQIRFRLTSNEYSETKDGWYVDDISIIEIPLYSYSDFHDDAETETSLLFSDGLWTKTSINCHSPSQSWTESPGGNYTPSEDTSLTSVHINLTGSSSPYLVFWDQYDIDYYAYGYIQISTDDGATWYYLKTFNGLSSTWKQEQIDLNAYKNEYDILIRFRLFSYSYCTPKDGWYIDDISIVDIP